MTIIRVRLSTQLRKSSSKGLRQAHIGRRYAPASSCSASAGHATWFYPACHSVLPVIVNHQFQVCNLILPFLLSLILKKVSCGFLAGIFYMHYCSRHGCQKLKEKVASAGFHSRHFNSATIAATAFRELVVGDTATRKKSLRPRIEPGLIAL